MTATLVKVGLTKVKPVNHANLFADLGKQVKAELVRKDRIVDAILTALVARHHIMVVSEPGVAKTLTYDRIVHRIDGLISFYRAVGAFTTPAHLFGQMDLPAVKAGHQKRLTKGRLPEADTACIDEWTRAGRAVMSEWLEAMNERTYEQDGEKLKMPLATAVLLCNFLFDEKDSHELAALYDRIMLRVIDEPIMDEAGLRELARVDLVDEDELDPVLSIDQVREMQAFAKGVVVPDEVIDAHIGLFDKLVPLGLRPSPRRFRESLAVVKAAAALAGRDTATVEDLTVLADVFWDRPEGSQPRDVERAVWQVSSPALKDVSALIDSIAKIQTEVEALLGAQGSDIETGALALRKKVKRVARKVQELRDPAGPRGQKALDDIWRRCQDLHDQLMESLAADPVPMERALEL